MTNTWHSAFLHCRLCTCRKVKRPQEDTVCPTVWLSALLPMTGSVMNLKLGWRSAHQSDPLVSRNHIDVSSTLVQDSIFSMDAGCLNRHLHIGTGSILTSWTFANDNGSSVSITLKSHYYYNEGFLKPRKVTVSWPRKTRLLFRWWVFPLLSLTYLLKKKAATHIIDSVII